MSVSSRPTDAGKIIFIPDSFEKREQTSVFHLCFTFFLPSVSVLLFFSFALFRVRVTLSSGCRICFFSFCFLFVFLLAFFPFLSCPCLVRFSLFSFSSFLEFLIVGGVPLFPCVGDMTMRVTE